MQSNTSITLGLKKKKKILWILVPTSENPNVVQFVSPKEESKD